MSTPPSGSSPRNRKSRCLRTGSDQDLRWWRGRDLNPRPSGYEPDELPDCSTPRRAVDDSRPPDERDQAEAPWVVVVEGAVVVVELPPPPSAPDDDFDEAAKAAWAL